VTRTIVEPTIKPRPNVKDAMNDPLTGADLAGKSDEELSLLRNSYYARHGYAFPGNGPHATKIRHYFLAQPWYNPDTDDDAVAASRMTAVERIDIALIRKIETERKSSAHKLGR